MSKRNFFDWEWRPMGAGTLPLYSAVTPADVLCYKKTSTNAVTAALQEGPERTELLVATNGDTEVENICVYTNDVKPFDVDRISQVEFRVRLNQSTWGAAMSLGFGLATARNDALASISSRLLMVAAGSTALVAQSDDNTTDSGNLTTGGLVLSTSYRTFLWSFEDLGGKTNIRLFAGTAGNLAPVALSGTLSLSAYSGLVQPYFQVQKTSAATAEGACVDYIRVRTRDAG